MQYISLIPRILLATLFVLAGYGKITAIAATQGYMESMGIPGILVYPTLLLELGGGIMIILGFQTRIVQHGAGAVAIDKA